ncbi:MAG: LysR family transcriptional regulator [Burkholderiales bacterium]|nr:LysR family transcriptional regulator [Burkholderiales bacterium]
MDKLRAMEIFAKVAEQGSFVRAADRLGLSPAAVTAAVKNLEAHLGVQLFTRTTRKVSLTVDGGAYLEHCTAILSNIDDIEGALRRTRSEPEGRLRVALPTGLGHLYVSPGLPAFCARFPKVTVIMTLGDRFGDFIEEDVDVILRVGEPQEPSMVARHLYDARFVTCASPAYLARHGVPDSPDALAGHNCLGYFSPVLARAAPWRFSRDGVDRTHEPEGRLHLNNPEVLVDMAIAGVGIIQLLETGVAHALRDGRLVPLLPEWQAASLPVSVMYWPSRHLSARVRVFVDFLAELFARQLPHLQAVRPSYGRGG